MIISLTSGYPNTKARLASAGARYTNGSILPLNFLSEEEQMFCRLGSGRTSRPEKELI
jgi:hypothetical protein